VKTSQENWLVLELLRTVKLENQIFFALEKNMISGTVLVSLLFKRKSKNQGGSHTDGSLKLVRTAQH
jgi:hypothetical protein